MVIQDPDRFNSINIKCNPVENTHIQIHSLQFYLPHWTA